MTCASAASDSLANALSYVPPPAIGGWRAPELSSDALVGCMRWLGGVSRGREGERKELAICAVEADRTVHGLRRAIRPRHL